MNAFWCVRGVGERTELLAGNQLISPGSPPPQAHSDAHDECYGAGVDDYITKPVSVEIIRRALVRAQAAIGKGVLETND